MVDALCTQLDNRFQGMKYIDTYQVIQPEILVNASEKDVHNKAVDFVFWMMCLEHSRKFEKLISAKELADLLIVDHSTLSLTYPDVFTLCIVYLTVPVTLAKNEWSFSKLKVIKNYLPSSMVQERHSNLA
ncbi:hypothetical protein PR048_028816, partial [Dryococelus australis]